MCQIVKTVLCVCTTLSQDCKKEICFGNSWQTDEGEVILTDRLKPEL